MAGAGLVGGRRAAGRRARLPQCPLPRGHAECRKRSLHPLRGHPLEVARVQRAGLMCHAGRILLLNDETLAGW